MGAWGRPLQGPVPRGPQQLGARLVSPGGISPTSCTLPRHRAEPDGQHTPTWDVSREGNWWNNPTLPLSCQVELGNSHLSPPSVPSICPRETHFSKVKTHGNRLLIPPQAFTAYTEIITKLVLTVKRWVFKKTSLSSSFQSKTNV